MVRDLANDLDLVSLGRKPSRDRSGPCLRRAHLRREVLREDDQSHVRLPG
jgi:hypothetical protein